MPVLPTLPQSNVKQIYLPSTSKLPIEEQAWVKMEVNTANVKDWLQTDPSGNLGKLTINILTDRIKEWNYTEVNGTPVPINAETVVRMGIENLTYLANQIESQKYTDLSVDEKKS
jgi:hypothetical protein